ncbi:MAG: HlyC/CorC family transporter [Candidatus Zixiibacteriota bacterium]|nr:MAG: HlyC/CorC family transporter [candidate division Zixibacteria bacterium]
MADRLPIELLAILILVLANGFFALSEFSIIASRKSRLREDAARRKMGAAKAQELRDNPERFLATIQVGITLVGAMLGVFSGITLVGELQSFLSRLPVPFVARVAAPLAYGIVVVAITVLSVVLGELVPKYIALSFPEKYARLVAGPLKLFVQVTSFLSRFLAAVASLIVRALGVRRGQMDSTVSEEEINLLIRQGKDEGVFGETEQSFIRSVFDFTNSTVKRAMKPRADVVGFEKGTAPQQIVNEINRHGYSRYPVYDDTIDRVLGIIYAKDLIGVDVDSRRFSIEKTMRKPLFVPDSMPLARLLKEFQKGKNHIAIVLDEYGGTFGIITLEDILEELVGEIRDEYDDEAAPLVRHSDQVVFADGTVWPGEVNDLLQSNLPEEKAETLAGLFIDTVDRFPDKNESIQIEDVRLTVLAKEKNRILRLKVEKIQSEQPES